MPEGDTIHRAASALRTALTGRPMWRFDAPRLMGPTPQAGRVIERVESHGRHLEIEWDDGLVLDTNMRMSGTWHLYRRGDAWRRSYNQMRAAIEVDNWVAVCFNAAVVETFRQPDRRRHPGMGRIGPNLTCADIDLGQVVNLLLSYPDADATMAEVMLDQRVMHGVGNVYRCEVLWSVQLSPFARVGDLTEHDAIRLANTAASRLRASLHGSPSTVAAGPRDDRAVYGRNGQRCDRCGQTIDCRRSRGRAQMLYWCPGCQSHLDPRRESATDDTPMDPHPAAAKFLTELPWRREVS